MDAKETEEFFCRNRSMRRTRKRRNGTFTTRRGTAAGIILYRTAKELSRYGRGVYGTFSDVNRIAGVVKKLLGNEHIHNSTHCAGRRIYGFGRAIPRPEISWVSRGIEGTESVSGCP